MRISSEVSSVTDVVAIVACCVGEMQSVVVRSVNVYGKRAGSAYQPALLLLLMLLLLFLLHLGNGLDEFSDTKRNLPPITQHLSYNGRNDRLLHSIIS